VVSGLIKIKVLLNIEVNGLILLLLLTLTKLLNLYLNSVLILMKMQKMNLGVFKI